MVLQYCSDLHLEFSQNREYIKSNPLIPRGDVLILAGDIVPFAIMHKHNDFFNYVSDHFRQTYWLPGNHEYYASDAAHRSGKVEERIRENVLLLNNMMIDDHDQRLIFSTLWSSISQVNEQQIERGMNDFHVIGYEGKKFSASVYNQFHADSVKFIESSLEQKTKSKKIVITHHIPTFRNYPQQYKGDILNEAFAVDLDALILKQSPDYWIYGHHHSNRTSFRIGETQMLTNQLGYVKHGEHLDFKMDKCIER